MALHVGRRILVFLIDGIRAPLSISGASLGMQEVGRPTQVVALQVCVVLNTRSILEARGLRDGCGIDVFDVGLVLGG